VDLIYFVLTAFGLTQILVYGKLFDGIRPSKKVWKGFFHCPMCVGFWVGAFLFGVNRWTELFTFEYGLVNFFVLSWLASGTTYLLTMFLSDFGFRVEVKNNDYS
jgi:fructose-specific phosphotransferase system IIC component